MPDFAAYPAMGHALQGEIVPAADAGIKDRTGIFTGVPLLRSGACKV